MAATHYERLGVARDADLETIRASYRELARRYHPDVSGANDVMPAINRAWFVLSDVGRRAVYDAQIGELKSESAVVVDQSRITRLRIDDGPARFPWKFVLALVALATLGILVMGIIGGDPSPTPIDKVVQPGSCVDVDEILLEVVEVPCDGAHEGVVAQVVPFDAVCPSGRPGLRDRQGMGRVCLEA